MTLGVALSISFSSPDASPLPLVLVGVLIIFFLMLEARRYRYFNVWRARARWMEMHFYAAMLDDGDLHLEENWQKVLARDYRRPGYHVSYFTAIGRRIRRNYLWILLIQTAAYAGKVAVHPGPIETWQDVITRSDVGPVPGEAMLGLGAAYVISWIGLAIWSEINDSNRAIDHGSDTSMG